MASRNMNQCMERIPFDARKNNLTVLVWNIKPHSTTADVKELLALNGLINVIMVYLGNHEKGPYAICVLSRPSEARKAMAMGDLASAAQSSGGSRVIKALEDFEMSLLACEGLLNVHLPLRWSHEIAVIDRVVNGVNTVRIIVKLLLDGDFVNAANEELSVDDSLDPNDLKRVVGKAFRKALDPLDVIVYPGEVSRNTLEKVKRHITIEESSASALMKTKPCDENNMNE